MGTINTKSDSNPWGRESLDVNPYRRSAFAITRAIVCEPEKRKIAQRASRTKKIVALSPDQHRVGGEPVTEKEINQALSSLLNPSTRIMDELLVHHPVEIPWRRLERLEKEIDQAIGRKIGVRMGLDECEYPSPFG